MHGAAQVGDIDRQVGLVGFPQPGNKLLGQPVEFAYQIRREPGHHRSARQRSRYLDHGSHDIPDAVIAARTPPAWRQTQCTMTPARLRVQARAPVDQAPRAVTMFMIVTICGAVLTAKFGPS